MPNLIITLVGHYDVSKIEPFLASWHEHAGGAKLVIFTTGCDRSVHQACDRLGVETIEVSPQWRYSLLVDRHLIFRDYLAAHGREFDKVLISDARDVIFQGDPFKVPLRQEVSFAAEDEVIRLCKFNRLWMTSVYGGEMAEELGDKTIACAGTTIGTSAGVLKYLDLMCREFEDRPEAAATWADQGFHNYILYKRRPDFIDIDLDNTVVRTLTHTDPARLSVGGDKVLVDGLAAPVVHQWDRHPDLVRFLTARYVLERAASRPAMLSLLRRRGPVPSERSSP